MYLIFHPVAHLKHLLELYIPWSASLPCNSSKVTNCTYLDTTILWLMNNFGLMPTVSTWNVCCRATRISFLFLQKKFNVPFNLYWLYTMYKDQKYKLSLFAPGPGAIGKSTKKYKKLYISCFEKNENNATRQNGCIAKLWFA